ncbi:MAG: hypothetical protein HRU70_07655 [Phycisphaeraceae bacterium]|nr:MAG: hypothetical protein HRU70_07655 [Phycisphaeraceae bacterium]
MTRSLTTVLILASVGLASPVLAQGQRPGAEPALRGPAVRDGGQPGQRQNFAPGQRGQGRAAADGAMPMRQFMRALEVVRGEKAAAEVRLTSDQDSRIKVLTDEFEAKQTAFVEKHRAEIESLAQKLPPQERRRALAVLQVASPENRQQGRPAEGRPEGRPGRPAGDRPADDMMAPERIDEAAAEKARTRLREITEGAPKPADTQTKVLGVLTSVQRPLVDAELARMRQQGGMGGGQMNEAITKAAEDGKITDAELDALELPERLKERLRNMSPEERAETAKNLGERMRNPDAQRGRPGQQPGNEQRPAPGPNDVRVPRAPR